MGKKGFKVTASDISQISSKHINARPYQKTLDILGKYGLKEEKSIATNFISQRLLTYKITKYSPKTST